MQAPIQPGDVRAIAIHLPQFHPVADNDAWWGKGFTEWTNVTKARPLFPGHHQPHLPADLGYYDLRLPETRAAQAQLAQRFGISAFCYYHYWFSGRRILERPVDEIVASGEPDFPFCLCWANESWTRTWDTRDAEFLIEQTYSPEDDRAHIRALLPTLSDKRYLRIDGKLPLFIYRAEKLPDPAATAAIWREEVNKAGLGELYLGAFATGAIRLERWTFDAAVEFVPCASSERNRLNPSRSLRIAAQKIAARMNGATQPGIFDYSEFAASRMASAPPGDAKTDQWLRCVMPSWDNSARRLKRPLIFTGSSPEEYEKWLESAVRWTRENHDPGSRFVFINAWNEWAEGNHLEPDTVHGLSYLEATARALGHGDD